MSRSSHTCKPGSTREVLYVALPMVASCGCHTVMTFTDRLFLSKLGPEQMNAAMGGGLSSFVMMTFFIGLTGYSTALVAQYLGAGRKERCARATFQALLIGAAAYPVILLCRPFAYWLFDVSGIAPEQLAPQRVYFDILVYACVIGLLRNGVSCFFSGVGRTRIVMFSAVTAMVVNIAANYVLIFGKFGAPALGIRGAALGTVLGDVCGLAVLACAYFARGNRTEFQVLQSLAFDREAMGKLLRFGYPAGIEFFLNLLAFAGMITVFHSHSLATASAVTIVFNWDMVSFVPLIGMEIGVTSLVGRYMGAGQPDIAHRSTMSALRVGWVYSSVILVLFVFFPERLVDVFRPDGELGVYAQARPLAVKMLRMASLYVMIEAVLVVFAGALRGAGDTFWTMCTSVAAHWIMLPILILMLRVFGCSVVSSWSLLIVSFLLFSGVFWLRYRGGRWRTLNVLTPVPSPSHVAETSGAPPE
ncbi:MAG: MATE family efflux transporter [Lentisphaeria bacterium]|nr:MATE family efflux transporter [Lentisphaeria bacterium]